MLSILIIYFFDIVGKTNVIKTSSPSLVAVSTAFFYFKSIFRVIVAIINANKEIMIKIYSTPKI